MTTNIPRLKSLMYILGPSKNRHQDTINYAKDLLEKFL